MSMLKGSKINKIVYTSFICLGAGMPFFQFAINPTPISLVSSIALSLMLSFAYLVIYSLLVLPSFADADAFSLLSALPFNRRSLSAVTMFSFLRTFDYLALGSILVSTAAVSYFTQSIPASILMLFATTANVVFAVFTGLWLSRLFYRSISRGGRSRGATLWRTIFIVAWGVAVLSVGFAFNTVVSFLPYLNDVLSGNFSQLLGIVISIFHPFTFGLAISSVAYPETFTTGGLGTRATLFSLLTYASAIVYAALALIAVRRTTHIVAEIGHGHGVSVERVATKDFTLKLRNPLSSFITKDMRIATKNPSTALILAMPVFEILVVLITFLETETLSVIDFVVMMMITSSLSLMAGYLLLYTEYKGLGYTLTLPLGRRLVVNSKSLISTLLYLPVPFVLLALQLIRSGAWSAFSLLPFILIFALSAATTAEISVLISGKSVTRIGADARRTRRSASLRTEGFSVMSGTNVGRLIGAIVIGVALLVLPVAVYFTTVSLYHSELVSILIMTLVTILEFGLVHGASKFGG